jgi:hypothetical protein
MPHTGSHRANRKVFAVCGHISGPRRSEYGIRGDFDATSLVRSVIKMIADATERTEDGQSKTT